VLGVQCTSGANVAARVDKITNSDAIHVLRIAGWRVAVWGWRKNAKGRYVLREVDLSGAEPAKLEPAVDVDWDAETEQEATL
jgi:hypothetical protein